MTYLMVSFISVCAIIGLAVLLGRSAKRAGKLEAEVETKDEILDDVAQANRIDATHASSSGFRKRVRSKYTRK